MSADIANRSYYVPGSSVSSHPYSLTLSSGTKRKVVLAVVGDTTTTVTAATFDSNSMTQDIAHTNSGNANIKVYLYRFDVADGTPAGSYAGTFTTAAAATRVSAYAWEIAGAALGAPEATNIAQGTAAAQSPSLTSTAGAALVIVGLGADQTSTFTLSGDVANEQEGNEVEYTSVAGDASNVSAGTRSGTATCSEAIQSKSIILASYAQDSGQSNAPRSMFYHLQGMR